MVLYEKLNKDLQIKELELKRCLLNEDQKDAIKLKNEIKILKKKIDIQLSMCESLQ